MNFLKKKCDRHWREMSQALGGFLMYFWKSQKWQFSAFGGFRARLTDMSERPQDKQNVALDELYNFDSRDIINKIHNSKMWQTKIGDLQIL
jgi:hypothetical protein